MANDKNLDASHVFKNSLKMMDDILEDGAKKHGLNSWLDEDNPSLELRACTASLFRHISMIYAGEPADKDSGLPHELHAACRLLMLHERKLRGIDESPTTAQWWAALDKDFEAIKEYETDLDKEDSAKLTRIKLELDAIVANNAVKRMEKALADGIKRGNSDE